MSVIDELENYSAAAAKPRWEGTFRDFLQVVRKKEYPSTGNLAHQRVASMVLDAGTSRVDHFGNERTRYEFFEQSLYGIEGTIDGIMQYIMSASQRTETSRRLLLLYGPPSSGKSEIVTLLKRGLEQWTRTKEGAVFAIKGSPMHENPFLLVPKHLRDKFAEEYGVAIEGKLSPIMQYRLDNEYNGKFMDVPIEQVYFSEAARIGIGTWLPSDTKCLSTNCLLLTKNGLVRGEDVFVAPIDKTEHVSVRNKHSVVGSDRKDACISKVFDNGIRPVCQIQMRGMSIEATENHRFMAVDSDGNFEWVHVSDLHDRSIPIAIGSNSFSHQESELVLMDESSYSDRHHHVITPEFLNARVAKLAGYLVAEGYCDHSQISFCNQDEEINKDYKDILESEFGCFNKIDNRDVRRSMEDEIPTQRGVVVSKQKFVDFINVNFETNKNAWEKRVPRCVLSSPKDCQIAFLEGLYLVDGCAYERDKTVGISLSSCSRRLVEDVQAMLINLGVYGCVDEYVDKKYPSNIQYRVTSEGADAVALAELLPEFVKHRKLDLSVTTDNHKFCYESFGSLRGLIEDIRSATRGIRDVIDRRYTIETKNGRSPTRNALEKWLEFLESDKCEWTRPESRDSILSRIKKLLNHRCVPVTSIEYIGHKPVYDISVDNQDHSFIVNGMISHNSQDVSELVGGLDYARIQDVGDEGDPRAYNFNGELNIANRGIMEFIEGLKADEKFLRALLTATQEKSIKAPRFGLINIDCFIVLHTNEEEFINFMAERKYEAYHDRMVMVPARYNLGYSNEVKIYEKLLAKSDAIKKFHIAPHTLDVAAMFAVLTRLVPSESDNLVKKMKLYNKEHVRGRKIDEVPDIQKKSPREGMAGVSPRFVIDQIAIAISRAKEQDRDYVLPLDVLRQLNEGVRVSDRFSEDEKQRCSEYIDLARDELNDFLRNDIQKAFFISFDQDAKNLFETYLEHIEAAMADTKPRDPVTGEEVEVNTKLIESIENHIEITSSGRSDFRNEILRAVASSAMKNKKFDYMQHVGLREAIQKQLFHERQGVIRMTVSARNPDPEQLKRINAVVDRMCEEQGYTAASANEILKYASSHLFEK